MPNDIWDDPYFSGSAERVGMYAYLIRNAAFKPHTRTIKGTEVSLQRGQLLVSQRYMAQACGVTRSKVQRFISQLEADKRITIGGGSVGHHTSNFDPPTDPPTEPLGMLITICNYGVNPDLEISADPPADPPADPQGVAHRSKREEGIKKKGNKNIYTVAFEEFWNVYPRKEAKRHAFKAYEAALKREDASLLLEAATAFSASWRDRLQSDPTSKRFIPHPATWLNGDSFNDWAGEKAGDPLEQFFTSLKPDRQEQIKRLIDERRQMHDSYQARKVAAARRSGTKYTPTAFVVTAEKLHAWVQGVGGLKYLRHALAPLAAAESGKAPPKNEGAPRLSVVGR